MISIGPARSVAAGLSWVLLTVAACQPAEDWRDQPFSPQAYDLPTPPGFMPMVVPPDNPTTVAGVALGRRLFYDPSLAGEGGISCATCHRRELAFTDGRALSQGVDGRRGRRSAPSLLNIGFHFKGVFWDGRSPSLEEQALHPIEDSTEMGGSWPTVLDRLRSHEDYLRWFRAAFGIEEREDLTRDLVGKALAQFQRSLVSADSKFDRWQRGEAQLAADEERGRLLFFDADYPRTPMAECNHCHNDPLFTNLEYLNNGLDHAPNLAGFEDPGRGAITGRRTDNGKFRVPTLRNVALTAPYMHDGRFATLEAVLDHYDSGGAYALNVNPNVRPLHLTDEDRNDLLAFLQTLTDSTALSEQAFGNPWINQTIE